MLDAVIDFMPAWQRGLIAREGSLVLIKAVIAAKAVHQLLVAEAPVWMLEEIKGWMRSFLWAGKKECWPMYGCLGHSQ